MAVIWKDQYHDTTKIKTAPDSRKRIKQLTDAGLIMGDSIADESDFTNIAELNRFWDTQGISADASVTSNAFSKWLDKTKSMKVAYGIGAGSLTSLQHSYQTGGGVSAGGWKDGKFSMYFYIDDTMRTNTNYFQIVLTAYADLQTVPFAYIKIDDWTTNKNFFVSSSSTVVDSGIQIPTTDEWVKLEFEVKDGIIYYNITSPTIGKQTSNVTKQFEDIEFGNEFRLNIFDDGGGGNYYFAHPQIETHLEQNDDTNLYSGHQQEFKTTPITNVNWYQWDQIDLKKLGQSNEDEKFISCSILDSSENVISGYADLTDNVIDISAITESTIVLYFKFWAENSYDSPVLEETKVTYFVTGGEVTLEVTGNTYNGDITTPINTKTGYRITFEATAETPDDPDTKVTHYWFDFGDGLNSGWITNNVVNHVYNKHSQNVSEAGADKAWQARVKVKLSDGTVESVTGWSNNIDLDVANSRPVARMWSSPSVVRMSGAGPSASVTMFGSDSFDQDDNGNISTSGGYLFDLGNGAPASYQVDDYKTHAYTVAGVYTVGLTVKDDLGSVSEKFTMRIKILPALSATIIIFNRTPRQADFDYESELQVTRTVAGGYPDVTPTSYRNEGLKISGQSHLSESDFTLMKQYTLDATLVTFKYNDLDSVAKTFTGYIKTFRGSRRGGFKDDVPWTATLQHVDV